MANATANKTDQELREQGGRAYMMIIDNPPPFKTERENKLWRAGYLSAKQKWEANNHPPRRIQ
jgi:hypothetical protein